MLRVTALVLLVALAGLTNAQMDCADNGISDEASCMAQGSGCMWAAPACACTSGFSCYVACDGVSSQSDCDAAGPSGTLCTFSNSAGVDVCACVDMTTFSVEYACASIVGGSDDTPTMDDDDNMDGADDDMPSLSTIIDAMVSYLGESCRSAVQNSLKERMFGCDNFITGGFAAPSNFDDICSDQCTEDFAKAFANMDTAGCIPSISMPANEIEELLYDLAEMGPRLDALAPMCARSSSNGQRCGNVLETLDNMYTSGVSEADCQTAAGYGACLGTFLAELTSDSTIFSPIDSSFTLTNFNALVSQCSAVSTDLATELAQAVSVTEAPADLTTSSAATVSGVAALAGAALFAAIMA